MWLGESRHCPQPCVSAEWLLFPLNPSGGSYSGFQYFSHMHVLYGLQLNFPKGHLQSCILLSPLLCSVLWILAALFSLDSQLCPVPPSLCYGLETHSSRLLGWPYGPTDLFPIPQGSLTYIAWRPVSWKLMFHIILQKIFIYLVVFGLPDLIWRLPLASWSPIIDVFIFGGTNLIIPMLLAQRFSTRDTTFYYPTPDSSGSGPQAAAAEVRLWLRPSNHLKQTHGKFWNYHGLS